MRCIKVRGRIAAEHVRIKGKTLFNKRENVASFQSPSSPRSTPFSIRPCHNLEWFPVVTVWASPVPNACDSIELWLLVLHGRLRPRRLRRPLMNDTYNTAWNCGPGEDTMFVKETRLRLAADRYSSSRIFAEEALVRLKSPNVTGTVFGVYPA
jgi:hypothetical protein